jgi:hypothetical protein
MAYELARHGSTDDILLGSLLEMLSESESWLSAQSPSIEWDGVAELLRAANPKNDVKGMSNTGYDLVARNARDIVASLSNFRHELEFKPRFNKTLYNQAHVLTKLDRNWYTETDAHDDYRANLQNAVAWGTGYLYETWNNRFHGTHGDIDLQAYGPSDVTFVQLPRDHDIQKAYMVIIREEVPINLAKMTYENIADNLTPDRDAPGWIAKGLRKVQQLMGGSPALRVGGRDRQKQTSFPTVDIFHAYTLDRAINLTSGEVTMGTRGTNWSYKVPALGSPMPLGVINESTGAEMTRPAEAADCRLFPLRRYTIFTRTAVAYDGSSPWWHGQVPLARVRFNDWAWEALGRSLLAEPRTMQDGIVRLMRYIEDACASRLDPALLYDDQLVSEGFAKNFNPRLAGSRAAVNLQAGDVMKVPLGADYYNIPTGTFEWVKQQEDRLNKQMGTPDLIAIAKAKQVPSSDAQEKLLEMAGPLVQDMMRQVEVPQRQLAEWRKAYYFQFYTRGRILITTGLGADDEESDFEYTPDKIVPQIDGETLTLRQERTKRYISEFRASLTESGINEMHRMTARLSILQLRKAIPIDAWTVADYWRVSNYGPKPDGTHNVMERFIAEQHMNRELAEEMGGGQMGGGAGRPHSNQRPPKIQQKDGGSRSTVRTS